jgi:hypothetical protein
MTKHRGKNSISRMVSGSKPTTYIPESQMNTFDNAQGKKHDFKND